WACGAVLKDDNGEFASPRWPYQYPSLSLCKWTIRAPYGSTIYLSFTSIELEEHIKGNCSSAYDRLEIFDGSTKNASRLASLCDKKRNTCLYVITKCVNCDVLYLTIEYKKGVFMLFISSFIHRLLQLNQQQPKIQLLLQQKK
ncbi:Hypothetical predicted protein, partial [Mytilus galloprovincialis]